MPQDHRAIDDLAIEERAAPVGQAAFRVFLREEAFDEVVGRGDGSPKREVGGVLVGEVLRDEHGPYVVVQAALAALRAEATDSELTFTHAAWDEIHREMDRRFANKRIVGWYHTHPNFGVFLSDRDQFIQRSFFDLPFQVALVYDPVRREHGVYAWRENRPWRVRQYWIGSQEVLWDGPRETAGGRASSEPAADGSRSSTPPPDERRGERIPSEQDPQSSVPLSWLAIGLVVAAVLGGFLGWQWGSRSLADAEQAWRSELSRREAEAGREAIAGLHADLLTLLREALNRGDTEALDAAARRIQRAVDLLSPTDAAGPEANVLRGVLEDLRRAHTTRTAAAGFLAELERVVRANPQGLRQLAERIGSMENALAQVCVELAASAAAAGDLAGAQRLLATAARVDPQNVAAYAARLQAIVPGAALAPPVAEAGAAADVLAPDRARGAEAGP
jgi:proteasome lid subunit RPN8/RPN11